MPGPAYSDHADFYRRGPYARYLTGRKTVGSRPVAMFAAEQPAGAYPDPPMPGLLLYLALQGAKEARFDWGAGRWHGTWRRHDLTLVPANAASDVTLSNRHGFLGLCLPVSLFADNAETLGPLHAAPFRDPLTAELVTALWRDSDPGGAACALFADNALACLTDRLRHLAGSPPARPEAPPLSPRLLARIDDHIRARLDQPITVAELARLAGHSPSHFSTLFRRATGASPYTRVLALRVEHAAGLIATCPDMPLAEIALASGFSSQSHLTSAFRRHTGTTPAARRAACRP